jgi:hypothetical protein
METQIVTQIQTEKCKAVYDDLLEKRIGSGWG